MYVEVHVHTKAGTNVRANEENDEMQENMKEKRKPRCVKGKKDEKGTKWRGRGPIKPNLIRNP